MEITAITHSEICLEYVIENNTCGGLCRWIEVDRYEAAQDMIHPGTHITQSTRIITTKTPACARDMIELVRSFYVAG